MTDVTWKSATAQSVFGGAHLRTREATIQKLRLRLKCYRELRQAFPNLRFGPRCEAKSERGLQLRFDAEEKKGSWSNPDFAGTPEDEWEVCFPRSHATK